MIALLLSCTLQLSKPETTGSLWSSGVPSWALERQLPRCCPVLDDFRLVLATKGETVLVELDGAMCDGGEVYLERGGDGTYRVPERMVW